MVYCFLKCPELIEDEVLELLIMDNVRYAAWVMVRWSLEMDYTERCYRFYLLKQTMTMVVPIMTDCSIHSCMSQIEALAAAAMEPSKSMADRWTS